MSTRRVVIEPARIRISKVGYHADTATDANLIFDTNRGVAGSVAMSGITYSSSSNFTNIGGTTYKCTIPFGRTLANPPGFFFGQLLNAENRVTMHDLRPAYNIVFYGTTTETELQLFIRLTGSPGVIIGPDPIYAFSWIIFN